MEGEESAGVCEERDMCHKQAVCLLTACIIDEDSGVRRQEEDPGVRVRQ